MADMVFIFTYCIIAGLGFAIGGEISDRITRRIERGRRRRR